MIRTFPNWPVWNYHFPELDVKRIVAVTYFDARDPDSSPAIEATGAQPAKPAVVTEPRTLDTSNYRLSIAKNGVSGLVFKPEKKSKLPVTKQRPDAVIVEYEV